MKKTNRTYGVLRERYKREEKRYWVMIKVLATLGTIGILIMLIIKYK